MLSRPDYFFWTDRALHKVLSLDDFGGFETLHINARSLLESSSSVFRIFELDIVLLSEEVLDLLLKWMFFSFLVVALAEDKTADDSKVTVVLHSDCANLHVIVEDVFLAGASVGLLVKAVVDEHHADNVRSIVGVQIDVEPEVLQDVSIALLYFFL